MEQHSYCLSRKKHHNPYMQSVADKYGVEAFSWFVLEKMATGDRAGLVEAEAAWYDKCPAGQWMNAVRPTISSFMTTEIRLKIAASVKLSVTRMWERPEVRERHARALRLIMRDPVVRQRISAAVKATKREPEVYARLCEVNREITSRPEVREKARARMLASRSDPGAKINSSESVAKLSASISAIWQKEGFREAMREKYAEAWKRPATRERHSQSMQRGEERESSKLTEEAVRSIRAEHDAAKAAGEPMIKLYSSLAARFGVHSSLVQMVAKRRRWKHVV